jgi:hypothetical protein
VINFNKQNKKTAIFESGGGASSGGSSDESKVRVKKEGFSAARSVFEKGQAAAAPAEESGDDKPLSRQRATIHERQVNLNSARGEFRWLKKK